MLQPLPGSGGPDDRQDDPRPPPTVPPDQKAVNRDPRQRELAFAKRLVRRSDELFRELFRESKGTKQYHQALGVKENMDQYIADLTSRGHRINLRLWKEDPLSDEVVGDVAAEIARRVTTWKHSPALQRQRQKQQAASRRKANRVRDARIRQLHDVVGLSNRDIGKEVGVSEGTVRNVLKRDADRLLKPLRTKRRSA